MITAGIAATRPIAVASKASAIPGATTAKFVVCAFEMPMKLFMMPQTVPNNPTKGAVPPMVARMPMRRPAARRALDAVEPQPKPFAQAFSGQAGGTLQLVDRIAHHRGVGPLLAPDQARR